MKIIISLTCLLLLSLSLSTLAQETSDSTTNTTDSGPVKQYIDCNPKYGDKNCSTKYGNNSFCCAHTYVSIGDSHTQITD